jgi:hypothetical protein
VLTGATHDGGAVTLHDLLGPWPVALLTKEDQ